MAAFVRGAPVRDGCSLGHHFRLRNFRAGILLTGLHHASALPAGEVSWLSLNARPPISAALSAWKRSAIATEAAPHAGSLPRRQVSAASACGLVDCGFLKILHAVSRQVRTFPSLSPEADACRFCPQACGTGRTATSAGVEFAARVGRALEVAAAGEASAIGFPIVQSQWRLQHQPEPRQARKPARASRLPRLGFLQRGPIDLK